MWLLVLKVGPFNPKIDVLNVKRSAVIEIPSFHNIQLKKVAITT